MVSIGLSHEIINRELIYLLKSRCVVAEHLRLDHLDDEDLICLNSTGFVHLDLLEDVNYLAAVSEDTWFTNESLAKDISQRISDKTNHYKSETALKNAKLLVDYLNEKLQAPFPAPEVFLEYPNWKNLISIDNSIKSIYAEIEKIKKENPWFNLSDNFKVGDVLKGTIVNISKHGLFVEISEDIVGLVHVSKLGSHNLSDFQQGDILQVRIINVEESRKRVRLKIHN